MRRLVFVDVGRTRRGNVNNEESVWDFNLCAAANIQRIRCSQSKTLRRSQYKRLLSSIWSYLTLLSFLFVVFVHVFRKRPLCPELNNRDYLLQGVLYMLGINPVVRVCYRRLSYYLAVARGIFCRNEYHVSVAQLFAVGIVAIDLILSILFGPYYTDDLNARLIGSRRICIRQADVRRGGFSTVA